MYSCFVMRQIKRTRCVKEMSQKAIVETIDVPINQIKPSPYQPRLIFDLEDLRESIQRDGMLVPLTVRRKDEYYELIDGERRTRLAKELGYKTVPCTVIEVDDQTARRMVYKVNKQRKNYTPEEEATFFKKLVEEEEMKPYEIETELRVDHHWVQACLNVWKFPEEIRENVFGSRPNAPYRLYMSDIRDLETVVNRNVNEAIVITREIIDKRMTPDEKRETIGRWEKRIDEETVKATQKALEKVVAIPEEVKLETPEELERAATTLLKEAKKKREEALTPKEKTERKRMQEEKRHRAEEDRKRREEEEKQRIEEEAKRRAKTFEEAERRQIEEEARKKAQDEILSNPQLLQEVAQRAREERSEEFAEMEKRAREAAESIAQPLAEALIKAEEDSKVARSSKERKLLENYMFLGSIIQSLRDKRIFCTDHDHEEPTLMWSCGTPITKTHEELKNKLRLGK